MQEQQMINSADLTLRGLLIEQEYLFRVSNYQRHYVWTDKEVRQFLTDGEFCWRQQQENQRFIHFAGQISLRIISEERDMRVQVEIVDGQQRLTTFMLLIAVASRMMLMEYDQKELAGKLRNEYFISRSDFGEDRERLQLSRKDHDFWKKLICVGEEYGLIAKTESQKHLLKAEKVIREYLRLITIEKGSEEAGMVLRDYIDSIALSFRFVLLRTSHPGYAYALYQIVNDRGVPLTSGELLKARTIELLTDKSELADRAEQIWDEVLEDSGVVTDRYLSWNYVAVTGKRMETRGSITIHELYERDVFCCYNKRILSEIEQQVIKGQLELLEINVTRMRVLTQGIIPEAVSEYTKILFEALIKVLKNTFCIPIYLKILEMNEKQAIKTLNTITPMLAKAFFIAKTMGGLHDNVISNCYLEILKHIDHNHANIDAIKLCLEDLIKRDKCKQEFTSKIKNDVYVRGASGNAKAKFLLLMLELYYLRQVEKGGCECGDDSIRFKLSELSVEHILKESVDVNEISKAFYSGLHKLGNLTLAGRKVNSRMKNADFEEKRSIYQLSPYCITREVGQLEHWRKENFDERQNRVTGDLKKAFEF